MLPTTNEYDHKKDFYLLSVYPMLLLISVCFCLLYSITTYYLLLQFKIFFCSLVLNVPLYYLMFWASWSLVSLTKEKKQYMHYSPLSTSTYDIDLLKMILSIKTFMFVIVVN